MDENYLKKLKIYFYHETNKQIIFRGLPILMETCFNIVLNPATHIVRPAAAISEKSYLKFITSLIFHITSACMQYPGRNRFEQYSGHWYTIMLRVYIKINYAIKSAMSIVQYHTNRSKGRAFMSHACLYLFSSPNSHIPLNITRPFRQWRS